METQQPLPPWGHKTLEGNVPFVTLTGSSDTDVSSSNAGNSVGVAPLTIPSRMDVLLLPILPVLEGILKILCDYSQADPLSLSFHHSGSNSLHLASAQSPLCPEHPGSSIPAETYRGPSKTDPEMPFAPKIGSEAPGRELLGGISDTERGRCASFTSPLLQVSQGRRQLRPGSVNKSLSIP